MDIILKNVNIKVQNLVTVQPQVLDNLPCDIQHTSNGYFLHKSSFVIYQFAVESGKTYKLNSRFNALSDTVQALFITTALTNTSFAGQYKQIPSNTVATEYNKYGESGSPTYTGLFDVEITASVNGYIICYGGTTAQIPTLIELS